MKVENTHWFLEDEERVINFLDIKLPQSIPISPNKLISSSLNESKRRKLIK